MPADSASDTFEDIDWENTSSGGLSTLSRRDFGALGFYLVMGAMFAYDLYIRPVNEPTFEEVVIPVIDFTITYNFSQMDWLYYTTLGTLFFFVVIPLWTNKRLTKYYWKEFKKNRVAVASLIYLIGVFLVSIVGTQLVAPPELDFMLQFQPPMFFSVESSVPIQCVGETAAGRCYGTLAHPFGTTARGKDILAVVIYGLDTSMKIGLIVPLIIITIGSLVGATAAYAGGMVDEVLMRYVDVQATFPSFFLFLILSYILSPSLFLFIILFGFLGWEGTARLVRSEALQRTEEEYVTAADSAGASTFYIIRRHIIPNTSSSVITLATLAVPSYILFEAALAFLGLGDPTTPSLGGIIADGRDYLSNAWWISTIPGIFLFFIILAFNFVGDALRDALDPRSEN